MFWWSLVLTVICFDLSDASSWPWKGDALIVWSISRPCWRSGCTVTSLIHTSGTRQSHSLPQRRRRSSMMVIPSILERPCGSSLIQMKMWSLSVFSSDAHQDWKMKQQQQTLSLTLRLQQWKWIFFLIVFFLLFVFAQKWQRISNLAACKVFCKDKNVFSNAHSSVGLLFCPQMDHSHCYLAAESFSFLCKENG